MTTYRVVHVEPRNFVVPVEARASVLGYLAGNITLSDASNVTLSDGSVLTFAQSAYVFAIDGMAARSFVVNVDKVEVQ